MSKLLNQKIAEMNKPTPDQILKERNIVTPNSETEQCKKMKQSVSELVNKISDKNNS